jgi:cytochrome c556
MRSLFTKTVACAVFMTATVPVAHAHGKDPHGGHVDAHMKKLHAMMPMFSLASAELESAIEKGDAAEAKVQADRILASVPDLKKSKPHKNVNQREKFVELATNLDKAVTSVADLAKRGDFAGAKAVFKKVETACVACHAKFR